MQETYAALIVGLSLGSNVGAFVGLDDTGDMVNIFVGPRLGKSLNEIMGIVDTVGDVEGKYCCVGLLDIVGDVDGNCEGIVDGCGLGI